MMLSASNKHTISEYLSRWSIHLLDVDKHRYTCLRGPIERVMWPKRVLKKPAADGEDRPNWVLRTCERLTIGILDRIESFRGRKQPA